MGARLGLEGMRGSQLDARKTSGKGVYLVTSFKLPARLASIQQFAMVREHRDLGAGRCDVTLT